MVDEEAEGITSSKAGKGCFLCMRSDIVSSQSVRSGRIKEAWTLVTIYESTQSSGSVVVFLLLSSDCVFFSHCQRARQLSAVRCILCPIVFHDGRALLSSL